ncbi:beta-2-glycoprotein 1 isoform X1 [Myiozetetes cayanensis]|uniref:beta-2-glycoprotein 1 isoform X1 n=1 Tax=Myiozetetes cayanensis TaxID=478635 RepID=UPI002160B63E|nr:beta-2-glycoprotein 1 isoform X1 [Myiozetetes cayanensis]
MNPLALLVGVVALSHGALAAKVCPRPPEVLFATIHEDKKVYEVGEEVEYTCRPGFIPNNGQRKYTCLPTGKWAFNTLLCLPKRCTPPGLLENGKIDFVDHLYQSTINFSCDPGYKLVGSRSSQCMADGKWTGTFPQCQPVTCPPPPIPEFGVLSYRRSKPGNVSNFLDTITFECVPPLALFGNETATCMANGNWSSIPECKVVTCPTPIGIENGFIEFAVRRTYHYNESVSFGCQPTYVMEGSKHSRCEKTGNWSTKPICRAPCKIPVKKAVVLYNGEKKRVQNDLKEGILHGETVSFFCKNKEKSCAYTVDVACVDGNFTLPACFKERGFFSTLVKKDPSDMKPCEDEA